MQAKVYRDAGFSVLDGAALVVASAVAGVHLRTPVNNASGVGWGLVWITFAGVAITTAGPFLWLVRRYVRRLADYPGLGDRLWTWLGIPWILAAPLRSPRTAVASNGLGLYEMTLMLSLGVSCFLVLAVLWTAWVLPNPAARPVKAPTAHWTDRLGLGLAVCWPLQCGFLLIVVDSSPVR